MKSFEDKLINVLAALTAEVHELHSVISAAKQEQAILNRLAQMEERIMANQEQLQEQLTADLKVANTQLKKLVADTAGIQPAVDALTAKIAELEAIIAAGGTIGQELIDAVAETKALAQTVDDNVPELPTPQV